jgi:hypothetical protein
VTQTIRHPTHRHGRKPDRAVFIDIFPASKRIQLKISRRAAAHVLRGARGCKTLIAFFAPAIEAVGRRHGNGFDLHGILPGQPRRLAGLKKAGIGSASNLNRAGPNADYCAIAIRIRLDATLPCPLKCYGSVGCVNFYRLAGRDLIDCDPQRPLSQAGLHNLLIEVGHGEVSVVRQAENDVSGIDLGPCVLVGVDAIADRYRKVERRITPLIQTRAKKRNAALQVTDSANQRGRIFRRGILTVERLSARP